MKHFSRPAAFALALSVAILPIYAFANGNQVAVFENPITANSIPQLLAMLLKFAVRVATVLCVIYLIWSGFLFVKAQGNEEELKRAKQAFFYSLIGTMLMLGAEVIAQAIAKTVQDISG